jgi:HEPN domain-containing protein
MVMRELCCVEMIIGTSGYFRWGLRRVRDWIVQALADLKAAHDLLNSSNYAWACFAGHQAAEKALKAILEHFGTPSTGHNLLEHLAEVSVHVEVSEELRDDCKTLNRYYIPTRYLNAFSSGAPAEMCDEKDAREAYLRAERVVRFAQRITGIAQG